MAKKSSSMSLVFGVGMLLAAIGFCLPIFQFNFFGSHTMTGFDLVGDGDTTIKIFTLLIFIGAIVGVVAAFLPIPSAKMFKLVGLLVSIVSFVVVLIMMMNSDSASIVKGLNLGKKAAESIFKSLYYGAYMIFAGWVIAIIGLAMNK